MSYIKEFNMKNKALEFATIMHNGQYRHDGTPYINHPIRVANYVMEFKKSKQLDTLITSAYLHDTIEDTSATYYDIVDNFGPQVASIVLELTNDEDLKNEIGKARYLEIKMKNMSSWALVIKLCDRLDNIMDMRNSNEGFIKRYIYETTEIIDYLVRNRVLSLTHINIIKRILDCLIHLDKYNREELTKLYLILQDIEKIECMLVKGIQKVLK